HRRERGAGTDRRHHEPHRRPGLPARRSGRARARVPADRPDAGDTPREGHAGAGRRPLAALRRRARAARRASAGGLLREVHAGVSHEAWLAAAAAVVLARAAELLHARRVRRLARLAFGPGGRPAAWVRAVPWLRAAGAGALAFGLVALLTIAPRVHRSGSPSEHEFRHLVLVLDVSPSMRLVDAGPNRAQPRMARAREVLESLFGRVAIGRYKISVVATYNGALPVVEDTLDAEVVRNVLGDLPMHYAF